MVHLFTPAGMGKALLGGTKITEKMLKMREIGEKNKESRMSVSD